jgi:ABC-2 type transport system permease protein
MKDIINIILRELRFIAKSKLYLFALFVFPIADILFLGGIYTSGTLTKLPMAVVDNDNTKLSRNIIRYFNASPDIDKKYRISNVEELKDLFNRQKAVLGLYIPKNTQRNIKKQKSPSITVFINSANYIAGNITDLDSTTILATIGGGVKYASLTKKGISPKQAMPLLQPVQVSSARLFNPYLNYNLYLTPGLWLSVLHQLLILAGVLTIATEFDLKTIKLMLRASRNNLFKALISKLVLYSFFAYAHFELLYLIFFPLFHIPIEYSRIVALGLSICFAFASISLGMFLAAILKTRLNALKGCLLISAPAFLLSGYTWPLDQMPSVIKSIVSIIPLTPFLEGFRKIYQQNLGIEFIYPFILQLIITGIIYFSLTYLIIFVRIKRLR